MSFQVSPGVEVKEIDLTNVIPAVSTSIGGFAGYFKWGPMNEVTLVSSEKQLLQKFGKPDSSELYADPFFQAASFLSYGDALKVVRGGSSDSFSNATDNGGPEPVSILSLDATGVADGSYSVDILGETLEFTVASEVATIDTNISLVTMPASFDLVESPTAAIGVGDLNGLVKEPTDTDYLTPGAYSYNSGEIEFTVNALEEIVITGGTAITNVLTANQGSSIDVDALTSYVVDTITVEVTSPALADGTYTIPLAGDVVTFDVVSGVATLVSGGDNLLSGDPVTGIAINEEPSVTVDLTFVSEPARQVTINLDWVDTTPASVTVEITPDAQILNGVWIPNEVYYEDFFTDPELGTFAAKYPGEAGNTLRVYALNATEYQNIADGIAASPDTVSAEQIAVYNSFDNAPEADEIHIAIIDTLGVFGEAGALLEKFAGLQIGKTAKTQAGATNYIKNVLNAQSRYIYLIKGDSTALTVGDFTGAYQLQAGSSASDETLLDSDTLTALDLLGDVETEDVNLLFSQIMSDGALLQNYVHQMAYTRKDAVAFLSPKKSATVGNLNPLADVLEFARGTGTDSITKRDNDGSYGVMDSGAVYIYDRYNDVYRYIPANGHIAGLCANTDDVAEPWFSPAGYNRGGLRGIVKLAFNPQQVQRDELYKAGINPIVTQPGQGTILFGDKTAQAKPSAFDRINVRRLFIVLEKAIATAAKYQLFELNDEFTRATFRNAVEPFLRDVKGRRGLYDFAVICDQTNNTPEVIDTNRFVADIYIKPARSINFITLNFIATRTGVDFAEIAGLSNA